MPTGAQNNFGQQLEWGDSPAALTVLGEVTDIRPPQISVAMINVTPHSATADAHGGVPEEFIPAGTYDPGDIQLTVNHLPGSTDDDELIAAQLGRVKKYFLLTDNSALPPIEIGGYGYVQAYNPATRPATSTAAKTAQITIKRTGVWAQADA